jgi:hypothetical protein
VAVVIIVTLLLARLRMARYLLHFREEKWDISVPTRMDNTFWGMLSQVYPLIYTPRTYRASENGLMIEGWYYVFPIPFTDIQSLSGVQQAVMSGTGRFFVTSGRQLIRLELLDSSDPLYISPTNRDELLRYLSQHVARQLASGKATAHRPGTSPGARETHPGSAPSRRPPAQDGERNGVKPGVTNSGGESA